MSYGALSCLILALGALPGEGAFLAGDTAERTGHYAQALEAYQQCAGEDAILQPYAELRVARCRARLGDRGGAESGYRALLEAKPAGPWARMARAYLAALLQEDKRHGEAAPLYAQALEVPLQPWWMERYAWQSAENLFARENTRSDAFAWYRYAVESASGVGMRLDAARRLAASRAVEDRAAAILGMVRSGAYQEAGKTLLGVDVPLEDGDGGIFRIKDLAALVLHSGGSTAAPSTPLESTAEVNGDSIWMRLFLVYAVRTQAARKHVDDAVKLCGILVKWYSKTPEAADTLWWLARYLEGEEKRNEAIEHYSRLVEMFPEHSRADDALLQTALLFEKAGDTAKADETFLSLTEKYPASPFCSQAYYTCAKRHAAAKHEEPARKYFENAVRSGLGDYYAHRALNRIKGNVSENQPSPDNLKIDGEHTVLEVFPETAIPAESLTAPPNEDARLARLNFFGVNGLDEGEWEALDLCLSLGSAPDAASYYHALAEAGFAHTALEFARAAGWGMEPDSGAPTGERANAARLRLEYPRAYWPQVSAIARETGVDPYLLLALARQESTFRAGVVSRAGATGVMQVMPPTAQWLAKVDPNVTTAHVENLVSPLNSFRVGAYYLMRMIDRSDGNLVYALASYNAGPGNCAKWRKRFPNYELDEFVEAIPFGETRQYVKKVLGNYAAYRSLYAMAEVPAP